MTVLRWRTWALALAFALVPTLIRAQVVVGTVRDKDTGTPIQGAMVRLVAEGTWTGRQYLTGLDGRFMLTAAHPGEYGLRVERIGFASADVGPVILTDETGEPFDIDLATAPIRLDGLQVEGGKRECRLQADSVGLTQTVWAEARKALGMAQWTERDADLRFNLEKRTVTLDASGRRILDEQRHNEAVQGGNSVHTLPPEDLAAHGYIRERDDFIYYYGPDAAVLLSDAFLSTHCFQVVAGREDEPGLVGLAFEPVPHRGVPDIQGVFWVGRANARLDRIEYSYSGYGRVPGGGRARGATYFARLDDGRWIVRDWSIVAPVLRTDVAFSRGRISTRVVVDRLLVEGSRVLSVRGDDVEWHSPGG